MVAHPVTQVIGEQALVDILDLSEVAWTCWGVSTPSSGLGLRMVKELDLQLALGMNERRLKILERNQRTRSSEAINIYKHV